MPLTLRRTVIAGQYCDDDYCVYDDGLNVGRILLHRSTPQGPQWAWHVNLNVPTAGGCNGRSASLDEAKSAFRQAWEGVKPTITDEKLSDLRDWQETEGKRHERRRDRTQPFRGDE
jgi:hypothetical protein